MNQDKVVQLLEAAKNEFDFGCFTVLKQAEFFKAAKEAVDEEPPPPPEEEGKDELPPPPPVKTTKVTK